MHLKKQYLTATFIFSQRFCWFLVHLTSAKNQAEGRKTLLINRLWKDSPAWVVMDKERKWKKISDGIKICKITPGEELVRKLSKECYGNGKTHSESGVQVFFFLFFWELRQSGVGQERWKRRNGGQQEVKGRAVARAGGQRVWPGADKASSPLSICSRVRVWPAEERGSWVKGQATRWPQGIMVSALLAGTHMGQDYKV